MTLLMAVVLLVAGLPCLLVSLAEKNIQGFCTGVVLTTVAVLLSLAIDARWL